MTARVLTPEQIAYVATCGKSQAALARELGVNRSVIHRALRKPVVDADSDFYSPTSDEPEWQAYDRAWFKARDRGADVYACRAAAQEAYRKDMAEAEDK